MLPAYIERCRTRQHRSDCEYLSAGQAPLTFENSRPFYCSCGLGAFPANYHADIPAWKTIAPHAVRAAISPCFCVPYVDDVFGMDFQSAIRTATTTDICGTCSREKSTEGGPLSQCAMSKRCILLEGLPSQRLAHSQARLSSWHQEELMKMVRQRRSRSGERVIVCLLQNVSCIRCYHLVVVNDSVTRAIS